ncbi:MFS transporter [Bauldia litoralis]|uniref:MFS transporter n=1 Tax=Bauldia litoralis TaxID=665467 RepID=UPI003296827F
MSPADPGAPSGAAGQGAGRASGGLVTPARLIMAVFFLQPLTLANWLPRIPDVAEALDLSHRALAVGLIGLPLGMFLGISVAGPLIERLTARRTILLAFVALCVAMPLPGFAPNVPMLFIALFLMGVTFALTDVGMNVEAARIEIGLGHRIMNTCHGFWSLGSMVGALMSGGIGELGIATGPHLVLVALILLPIGLATAHALPQFAPVPVVRSERAPTFALPSLTLLGLCLYVFGTVMVEQVARNWGGVFLNEVLDASPAAIGLSIGALSLFMAIGRFLGDPLSDRFGAVPLARGFGILAIAGIVLTVTAGGMVQAVAGFVAMGLGVSVGFPLAISAAAARTDRPPATNVAALAFFAYSSSLVGPTLVGFVSEDAGLRIGLASILPLVVLSTLLAGHLRRARQAAISQAHSG